MDAHGKKRFSLLLCFVLLFSLALPSFANEPVFAPDAYANILTGSDFQDFGTKAYDRFGSVPELMKLCGLDACSLSAAALALTDGDQA